MEQSPITSPSYSPRTCNDQNQITSINGDSSGITYDSDGNVTRDGSGNRYAMGRLSTATVTKLAGEALAGAQRLVTDYCFDPAGNRVKMTIDRVGTVNDEVVTYSYTDPVTTWAGNDRLYRETPVVDPAGSQTTTVTDYTYDANGSQLTKGSDSFTWDLRNRMIEATVDGTTTTYGYDEQGQRISFASEGVTTYLVNDWSNPTDYPQVVEEKSGASLAAATLQRSYAIGLRMEGQFDGNGAAFFLRDGHGSDRALLDDGGNVIRCFDYQAFGEAIGFDPAAAGTTQLFGGDSEFDNGSGLYYHDKRWREDFRFLAYDDYEADPSSPMGLHKYLYASANPIAFGDPSGHNAIAAPLGMGVLFADLLISTGLRIWAFTPYVAAAAAGRLAA